MCSSGKTGVGVPLPSASFSRRVISLHGGIPATTIPSWVYFVTRGRPEWGGARLPLQWGSHSWLSAPTIRGSVATGHGPQVTGHRSRATFPRPILHPQASPSSLARTSPTAQFLRPLSPRSFDWASRPSMCQPRRSAIEFPATRSFSAFPMPKCTRKSFCEM